jgi:hypothetical protein
VGFADAAALAAAEWADFGDAPLAVDSATEALWTLHAQHLSAFVLEADHGELRILQAPDGTKQAFLADETNLVARRARLYRDFLAKAIAAEHADRHFFFALLVGDGSVPDPALPIFGFQKLRGEPNLLLPDIDFLWNGFYEAAVEDTTPLLVKQPKAVFAGSTTGSLLTHALLDADGNQRVCSFCYFAGSDLVDYRLPTICQVTQDGVEDRLRALGIGGPRLPWAEQLDYRLLLSQDGNGATCSRVYLALRSNSVLVKYQSESVLFYFRALEPMVHFMPTRSDAETLALIEQYRFNDNALNSISAAARAFCARWLTRSALEDYSAALLRLYPARIGDAASATMAARFATTPRLPLSKG